MSKHDDLFALIQSLNQAEKRYVRLYLNTFVSQKETIVLRLFNYFVNQSVYDIKKLKKDFEGETFLKHLYKVKNEIKEKVSQSLFLYNLGAEKNNLLRLKHKINELAIFYNKGLLNYTLKQIKQLKKQARALESYVDLLVCIDWEERLILDSETKNPLDSLSKVYAERKEALELLGQLYKYHELFNQITAMSSIQTLGRKGVQKEEILKFLERNQLHTPPITPSPKISFFYHQTLSIAYKIIRELEKTYTHCKKCWELAIEHQLVFIGDNNYKTKILMNLLGALHVNNMQEEHLHFLDLLKSDPQIKTAQQFEKKAFIYIHELININLRTDYHKGIPIMKKMKLEIEDYKNHISASQLQEIYASSLNTSLALENYQLAYFWNEQILSQKVSALRTDLKQFAHLIQLLILHEQAQELDLENRFRAVSRYFRKHSDPHPFYPCSLEYFKKLFISFIDKKERIEVLKQYIAEIEEIDRTSEAANAYGMSLLYFWAKSQVAQQPLVEVLCDPDAY